MDKIIYMDKIDTLCFSGGGVKGVAFAGAISYLESINHINFDNIDNFIGTSVGSLYATLYAMKYSTDEIIDFILNFNYETLIPSIDCDNIFNNYGLCINKKVGIVLSHFIKTKYNVNDLTFSELYKLTNKKLTITGGNITNCIVEYFNYKNHPDMSITLAVEISTNIPIIFSPIKYNNNLYIDPGMTDNYPIKQCNQSTTLGLLLKENNAAINSLFSVINAALNMSIYTNIKPDENTLEIYTNCTTLEFNIKYEDKIKLMREGEHGAINYIKRKNVIIINRCDKDTQTDTIELISEINKDIKTKDNDTKNITLDKPKNNDNKNITLDKPKPKDNDTKNITLDKPKPKNNDNKDITLDKPKNSYNL
jgi:NTE family protein